MIPPDTVQPLPITVLASPGREYEDGSEERLRSLFDRPEAEVAREVRAVLETPTWAEEIHLSPQRHLLLEWFPFRPGSRLLEVGAGCGALTGLLAHRLAAVDALEASPRRADVVARRHARSSNVRVLVGSLADVPPEPAYDYVTLIGVLEYAGRFARRDGDDLARAPYVRLIRQAATVLREDGTALLAIENQLGLKYLAGHDEEHYDRPLVGIEDYIADRGARTFGRADLDALLREGGLRPQRWYYPWPDYKMPSAIYSDEQPLGSVEPPAALFPSPHRGRSAESWFSERRLAGVLQRNGLWAEFANSFLVVCGRG